MGWRPRLGDLVTVRVQSQRRGGWDEGSVGARGEGLVGVGGGLCGGFVDLWGG